MSRRAVKAALVFSILSVLFGFDTLWAGEDLPLRAYDSELLSIDPVLLIGYWLLINMVDIILFGVWVAKGGIQASYRFIKYKSERGFEWAKNLFLANPYFLVPALIAVLSPALLSGMLDQAGADSLQWMPFIFLGNMAVKTDFCNDARAAQALKRADNLRKKGYFIPGYITINGLLCKALYFRGEVWEKGYVAYLERDQQIHVMYIVTYWPFRRRGIGTAIMREFLERNSEANVFTEFLCQSPQDGIAWVNFIKDLGLLKEPDEGAKRHDVDRQRLNELLASEEYNREPLGVKETLVGLLKLFPKIFPAIGRRVRQFFASEIQRQELKDFLPSFLFTFTLLTFTVFRRLTWTYFFEPGTWLGNIDHFWLNRFLSQFGALFPLTYYLVILVGNLDFWENRAERTKWQLRREMRHGFHRFFGWFLVVNLLYELVSYPTLHYYRGQYFRFDWIDMGVIIFGALLAWIVHRRLYYPAFVKTPWDKRKEARSQSTDGRLRRHKAKIATAKMFWDSFAVQLSVLLTKHIHIDELSQNIDTAVRVIGRKISDFINADGDQWAQRELLIYKEFGHKKSAQLRIKDFDLYSTNGPGVMPVAVVRYHGTVPEEAPLFSTDDVQLLLNLALRGLRLPVMLVEKRDKVGLVMRVIELKHETYKELQQMWRPLTFDQELIRQSVDLSAAMAHQPPLEWDNMLPDLERIGFMMTPAIVLNGHRHNRQRVAFVNSEVFGDIFDYWHYRRDTRKKPANGNGQKPRVRITPLVVGSKVVRSFVIFLLAGSLYDPLWVWLLRVVDPS